MSELRVTQGELRFIFKTVNHEAMSIMGVLLLLRDISSLFEITPQFCCVLGTFALLAAASVYMLQLVQADLQD